MSESSQSPHPDFRQAPNEPANKLGEPASSIVDEFGHPFPEAYDPTKPEAKKEIGRLRHVLKVTKNLNIWLTAIIAVSTVIQTCNVISNNKSTGEQTGKLIQSANRIDHAADSFSSSAAHINDGVKDAVDKLNLQAGALMEGAKQTARLAKDAEDANSMNRITQEAQASTNRAILTTGPFIARYDPVGRKRQIDFAVTNVGPTRAINIQYSICGSQTIKWDNGTHQSRVEQATAGVFKFSGKLQTGSVPDIAGQDSSVDPISIQNITITNGMGNWEQGMFYLIKIDFDDIYGGKWEKKSCVMYGASKNGDGFGGLSQFDAFPCNVSGETTTRRTEAKPRSTKNH